MHLYFRIVCFIFLSITASVFADDFQSSQQFDHYTIHYSIFPSTTVPANIANLHQLTRGKDTVLINIVIIDENAKDDRYGQVGSVSGTAANLMQQQRELDFKAVEEPNTVYYIASLRHINEEVTHFTIEVDPEGDDGPYQLKFTKTLYIDPALR